MNRILGIIPARGGSKGIPRKNIQFLAGKPLISWTIEAALKSKVCDRVIVSTDDSEIANISLKSGAEVPFIRPAELSSDTATSISVVDHAINYFNNFSGEIFTHIILLQPTSPLRNDKDIRNAFKIARKTNATVVSVCEPQHHPFLLRTIRDDGTLQNFTPESVNYSRRQDFPRFLSLNGAIYIIAPEILKNERTFTPEKTVPYVMPPYRSIDIDTPWDFFLCDLIMKNRKKSKTRYFNNY